MFTKHAAQSEVRNLQRDHCKGQPQRVLTKSWTGIKSRDHVVIRLTAVPTFFAKSLAPPPPPLSAGRPGGGPQHTYAQWRQEQW